MTVQHDPNNHKVGRAAHVVIIVSCSSIISLEFKYFNTNLRKELNFVCLHNGQGI